MLRKAAMVFGVVFVALGLLGFVPALAPANEEGTRLLLGLFAVDGVHNAVHLVSGIAALVASMSASYSRLYFQIFGVAYGLITVLGLVMNPVLGFLTVNMADNLLHLVIAVGALYFGFVYKDEEAVAV